jgi:hypothetical protein
MREEVGIQGLKLDHIIKQSKTAVDHVKKSTSILIEVAKRRTRISSFYKFIVTLSLFLIALFTFSLLIR